MLWSQDITGAYCWYNNDIANKIPYGALYNWYAVNNSHNLAVGQFSEGGIQSIGWHIPTILEFQALADYLGASANYNTNTIGGKLKETGFNYWLTPNTGATNEVGFNGIGSGARTAGFAFINSELSLWSSSLFLGVSGCAVFLNYNDSKFICRSDDGFAYSTGYSIRCVR